MEENHIKGTNWTNEEAKELGRKVKSIRILVGMNQEEVAAKAGLAVGTVINIEAGRYNTGVRQLKQILDAMNYKIEFLPK